MKKTLTVALCLLMISAMLLTACQPASGDVSQAQSEASTDASGTESQTSAEESALPESKYYDEATGQYVLPTDMPEYKWSGEKTFTVCVFSQEGQATYYNEEIEADLYTTTDQFIRDAVAERNNLIEQQFNVKVKAAAVLDVVAEVKTDSAGSTHLYDAAMPFMNGAAVLAQEGGLFDLRDFSDYIHLDAPWWDQMATNTASIKNRVYFTTGDISIMPKIVSFAITFNKKMMAENYAGVNLYQKVEDHEWTYDYMIELSKGVTSDSDGEGGMTYKDTWGLSSSYQDAICYYLASGQQLCSKSADDIPIIEIDKDRSVTISLKVLDTLGEKDSWAIHCNTITGVPNIWQTSLDIFGEGRALFRTSAFSAIKKLRNYTDGIDFGVIPMPLMDDSQTEYYTPSNPDYANCVIIPNNVADAEFSAYMLEVLSCYSKNLLTPAYYEYVLKSRDMRDQDSEDMLDNYVFKNIVYDVGRIYGFGTIKSMHQGLLSSGSNGIVAKIGEEKEMIQEAIDKVVADYTK